MARGGQVQIWRCVLAGGVQRSSLSVKRTACTFTGAEASATACPSHGRGICFYRVGDYQIAPIAARSTAMGRWRLMPPGYGGRRLRAGRGTRDTSSVSFAGICLPAGRSAGLTGHRPVIQHCEALKGKANGGTPFNTADRQWEGLGDKKKRPGALLLALFISFW